MSTYYDVSDEYNNISLYGIDKNISCEQFGENDGGVWSSIHVFADLVGDRKVDKVGCRSIKTTADIYDVKSDTQLNNTCNCELIDNTGASFICPEGKFARTLYPLIGKTLCCALCSDDKIHTDYKHMDCTTVNKGTGNVNVSCPVKSLVRGVELNRDNVNVTCCFPRANSSLIQKDSNMKKRCEALGLQECNPSAVEQIEKECLQLGIADCNLTHLNNVKTKCDQYKMRYIQDGKTHNPDSHYECHHDNVPKMDNLCNELGVTECNWQNIESKRMESLKHLKQLQIQNRANVQRIAGLEKELTESPLTYISDQLIFTGCFLIFCLFFVSLWAFVLFKKK